MYGYDATSDTIDLHKAGKTFNEFWNPFTYLETMISVGLDSPDYAAAMRGVYNFVSEQAYLDGINKGLKGVELENNAKKESLKISPLSFEAFKTAKGDMAIRVTLKTKILLLGGKFFGGWKKTLNKVGGEDPFWFPLG